MIRAYKLQLKANRGKMRTILKVAKEYRKTARIILNIQLNQLYKTGKLDKNLKLKINSKLSARYLQTLQYQVVSILNSYLSNRQNDFISIVRNSSIDEDTKIKLLYINKYQKWFSSEVKIRGKLVDKYILKLARTIIKRAFKLNRFPNTKNIQLQLDSKVVVIKPKEENKATSFDYWIKLSTLVKGKPIYLPLKSNNYFERAKGTLRRFCQINIDGSNNVTVTLLKDVDKREYSPRTDKIALDLGLSNLFATDQGDLFGRNFLDYLLKMDEKIVTLQSRIQRSGIKLSQSRRYKRLIKKLRAYLTNEINRILNRIVEVHAPKEIVIERLDFRHPNLSRRMNRLLQTFGKGGIHNKLDRLKEEFNIKITEVNPAYLSQTCSKCGYVDKRNRKNREEFVCKFCNTKRHADVNAARNLLFRSSEKLLGSVYTRKSKVLDELVRKFIERHSKRVCSCPVILTNPYFRLVRMEPS